MTQPASRPEPPSRSIVLILGDNENRQASLVLYFRGTETRPPTCRACLEGGSPGQPLLSTPEITLQPHGWVVQPARPGNPTRVLGPENNLLEAIFEAFTSWRVNEAANAWNFWPCPAFHEIARRFDPEKDEVQPEILISLYLENMEWLLETVPLPHAGWLDNLRQELEREFAILPNTIQQDFPDLI